MPWFISQWGWKFILFLFLNRYLMITVYLQISSWLCKVMYSWTNSSYLAFNKNIRLNSLIAWQNTNWTKNDCPVFDWLPGIWLIGFSPCIRHDKDRRERFSFCRIFKSLLQTNQGSSGFRALDGTNPIKISYILLEMFLPERGYGQNLRLKMEHQKFCAGNWGRWKEVGVRAVHSSHLT